MSGSRGKGRENEWNWHEHKERKNCRGCFEMYLCDHAVDLAHNWIVLNSHYHFFRELDDRS